MQNNKLTKDKEIEQAFIDHQKGNIESNSYELPTGRT